MKCKFDIMHFAFWCFLVNFMKNGYLLVRERNIKLLLKTVTYIATIETVTCIITIEIVMCKMHCRKYYLHDCNRDSHMYNFNKIVTHIFPAETTCIDAVETSNCIIATETVSCIIATKRSTNIIVAESTTNIIAIEPQNLHNCNRRWHLESVSCIVPTEISTCRIDYRNFHLQKWCQSEILLVIIKKFSEWVKAKFKAK